MSRISDAVERAVVRTAGALPVGWQRRLGGAPVAIDGQTLHPEVRLALRLMSLSPVATFERLPLEEARAQIRHEAELFGGRPIAVDVEDRRVELPHAELTWRIYRPRGGGRPAPALLYFHGGGFVVGGLETCDTVCRFLCSEADAVVVSVDYRLAPEHPFPAAVEDAVGSYGALRQQAAALGADPARIAVGGDSAGGNLAAVVSQQAAGAGLPAPAFQLLFFPVTDLSTKHPSYGLFGEGFFLTEAQMEWYRGHYLPRDDDRLDPRASPLLAQDLEGQPAAYVAVAGFDPLRDEGIAYAERLRAAGVPVELVVHDDLVHGFVNALGVGRTGKRATRQAAAALRRALHPTRVPVAVE